MDKLPSAGVLFFLLLLLPVTPINAAQFVTENGVDVHYATFSSLLIPPGVAAQHAIVRAKNRIVINVSAQKATTSIPVDVEGIVTNLLNQQQKLTFSEVREADAIYYLANHLSLEHDILRFSIVVTPDQADPIKLEFLRRYD